MSYYLGRNLRLPFDEAVARAAQALKSEGFGIISEIGVATALKQKIGIDYPPYRPSRRLQPCHSLRGAQGRGQGWHRTAVHRRGAR